MAIAGPVIAGQGRGQHRPDSQQPLLGPGTFANPTQPDQRDLRRVNNAINRLHPEITEAGHGDAGIGHLRTAQFSASGSADQVAQIGHQLIETLAIDIMQGRGDQSAFAQGDGKPDVDLPFQLQLSVNPVTIQFRYLLQSPGHRFQRQHHRQQPLLDRPFPVLFRQPVERPAHIDIGGQVVMRDLPVGKTHRRRNRLTHSGLEIVRLFRFGGCRNCLLFDCLSNGMFNIGQTEAPLRTGSFETVEIDMPLSRQFTGGGRHPQPFTRLRDLHRSDGHFIGNGRQDRTDRNFIRAGLHQQPVNHASVENLNFEQSFFSFHLGDDVAMLDPIPRFDPPGDQNSLSHISAQAGHDEISHAPSSGQSRQSMSPAAEQPPPYVWRRASALRHCRSAQPGHQADRKPAPLFSR